MADSEIFDIRLSEVLCLIKKKSVSNIKSSSSILESQQSSQKLKKN